MLKKMVIGLAVLAGLASGESVLADPAQLTLSVGTWETLRDQYRKPEVDIDYRFGSPLIWILRPQVGVLVAGDGDYYGYAGFVTDFKLADTIVLTLNSSIGGYNGHGYNLGSHFEFRNGAEIAYRFQNDWRAGIGFYHISNAGLTRENGGSESALFAVTAPLPW